MDGFTLFNVTTEDVYGCLLDDRNRTIQGEDIVSERILKEAATKVGLWVVDGCDPAQYFFEHQVELLYRASGVYTGQQSNGKLWTNCSGAEIDYLKRALAAAIKSSDDTEEGMGIGIGAVLAFMLVVAIAVTVCKARKVCSSSDDFGDRCTASPTGCENGGDQDDGDGNVERVDSKSPLMPPGSQQRFSVYTIKQYDGCDSIRSRTTSPAPLQR